MLPAFPESTIAQRHKCSYSEHERISVCILGGLVEKGTDASIIVVVDKVTCTRSAHCSEDRLDSVHEILSDIMQARREGLVFHALIKLYYCSELAKSQGRKPPDIHPGIDCFHAIV